MTEKQETAFMDSYENACQFVYKYLQLSPDAKRILIRELEKLEAQESTKK